MAVTRRDFLRAGAAGLAASALPIWRSFGAVAASAPQLVVVFLRGGADGLDLVPPIGDPGYAKLRGAFAVPDPLPLGEDFGLHPALAALQPVVERGQLAVVHAVGSHSASRSHFEAQDSMELSRGDAGRVSQGWLTRALGRVAAPELFSHVALGLRPPLSLAGSGAFSVPAPQMVQLRGASPSERAELLEHYAGDSDPVRLAGAQALEADRRMRRALGAGASRSRRRLRGRRDALEHQVASLLALEEAGVGVRAAAMDLQGWDTHAGQRGNGGTARPCTQLGRAIAGLLERGGTRRDVLVVVMTEFGRTVRPNGSGGTDHGHGSVMLVAGPRVRGGVYGAWPGLASGALYEGRDLPITTDYRDVLAEALRAHLAGPIPPGTFPGYQSSPLGLIS